MKALHENGWFVDKINYHNKLLEEYYVLYQDDTEDYILLDDIDGLEVQLLLSKKLSRNKVSWFRDISEISRKFGTTKYLTSQHLRNSIPAKTFNS